MVPDNHLIEGPPLPKDNRRLEVIRIKTVNPQEFVIVSPRVMAVEVHWSGRSSECVGIANSCKGCQRAWPIKWKGYLHVQPLGADTTAFLELTDKAVLQLQQLTVARDTLRGTIVRIGKTAGGPKGRYKIDVRERIVPGNSLPPAEDPFAVLRFLWMCKRPVDDQ